jgi:hypothetical protein
MAQHKRAQTKNTEFTTIREGLNEMQWWIIKTLMLPEFPCITEWERNLNYVALDNCQQAGEKLRRS